MITLSDKDKQEILDRLCTYIDGKFERISRKLEEYQKEEIKQEIFDKSKIKMQTITTYGAIVKDGRM